MCQKITVDIFNKTYVVQ